MDFYFHSPTTNLENLEEREISGIHLGYYTSIISEAHEEDLHYAVAALLRKVTEVSTADGRRIIARGYWDAEKVARLKRDRYGFNLPIRGVVRTIVSPLLCDVNQATVREYGQIVNESPDIRSHPN